MAAELFHPPASVLIPKISLNAPVQPVGADSDGTQLVPSDNKTTSWWKHGAKPGEHGSAVIAGHYKVGNGSPGVFYRLNEVQVGENITVVDVEGQELTFKVVEREIYPVEEFPTNHIYSDKENKSLNLVTCTGSYLADQDDYSHRLVLYTIKQ